MERLPDVLLVLLAGSVLMAVGSLLLLVAAQRAGIRRSTPWLQWSFTATVVGVAWVLVR